MGYSPGEKRGPQESWMIFTESFTLEKTPKMIKFPTLKNGPSREVKT